MPTKSGEESGNLLSADSYCSRTQLVTDFNTINIQTSNATHYHLLLETCSPTLINKPLVFLLSCQQVLILKVRGQRLF